MIVGCTSGDCRFFRNKLLVGSNKRIKNASTRSKVKINGYGMVILGVAATKRNAKRVYFR